MVSGGYAVYDIGMWVPVYICSINTVYTSANNIIQLLRYWSVELLVKTQQFTYPNYCNPYFTERGTIIIM